MPSTPSPSPDPHLGGEGVRVGSIVVAATAEAVQDLDAWRFQEAPDDVTLVTTGQAGKEDES